MLNACPVLRALALAFLLAAASCATPQDMTLDRLIDRHTQARGGADAIEALDALRVALEIVEPTFAVRGDYRATRDGYMRIDVYDGDTRVFTEALGPDGGWQLFADASAGPKPLSEGGEEALARGVAGNLYGIHELPALGYKLAFAGRDDPSGDWMIDTTSPDGHRRRLYLSADTFLIVRDRATSALHPDVDPEKTRQETRYSDFRTTAGVVFAEQSEKFDFDKDQIVQTTKVTSRAVNPDLDPAEFRRPVGSE